MLRQVNTGWRIVTPGACVVCGFDDQWQEDGRGTILCSCQACVDCGELSAYGFHAPGCPQLEETDDKTTS